MYKIYCIPIIVACSLFCGSAIAQNFDRRLENPAYWKKEIAKSIATDIVNQVPDMIEEQRIEREQFEQSPDDAHLAKLKQKFFTYIKRDKINQARAISKMMAKKGDDTGVRYLQSLD